MDGSTGSSKKSVIKSVLTLAAAVAVGITLANIIDTHVIKKFGIA